MKASEAIEKFLVYYDRIYSLSAKGYEDEEILTFISDASRAIVDTAFRNKAYNLCPVIDLNTETINVLDNTNVVEVNLSTPIRHIISVYTDVSRTNYPKVELTKVEAYPVNLEVLFKIGDKSEISIFNNILYSYIGNKLYFVGDSSTSILNVYIKAVRAIPDLVYIPEIQDDTLIINDVLIDSVISYAANLAKAASDNIRVQQVVTDDTKS